MENLTKSDEIEQKPQRISTKKKKKLMIEVLENQMGNVTVACKQVGISRETHYKWLKEDPKYKKATEDIVYQLKDFFENALLKLVKQGNPMIVWNVNKTKNRDRGYYDKQEIEYTGNIALFTKEERQEEIRRLLKSP